MLKSRALDIDMRKLCDAYDWIEYGDLMSTKARANQAYSLNLYTPAAGMLEPFSAAGGEHLQ